MCHYIVWTEKIHRFSTIPTDYWSIHSILWSYLSWYVLSWSEWSRSSTWSLSLARLRTLNSTRLSRHVDSKITQHVHNFGNWTVHFEWYVTLVWLIISGKTADSAALRMILNICNWAIHSADIGMVCLLTPSISPSVLTRTFWIHDRKLVLRKHANLQHDAISTCLVFSYYHICGDLWRDSSN